MSLDLPITALAELIVKALRRVSVGVEINGVVPRVTVSYQALPALRDVDERLAKIETARDSLRDALNAMDDLKLAAQENRADLERVRAAISKAESDKAGLHAQIDALKQIAALDGTSVRQALGLPSEVDKWKERIWGFIFGVLAAAIVTLVWELWLKPLIESRH